MKSDLNGWLTVHVRKRSQSEKEMRWDKNYNQKMEKKKTAQMPASLRDFTKITCLPATHALQATVLPKSMAVKVTVAEPVAPHSSDNPVKLWLQLTSLQKSNPA